MFITTATSVSVIYVYIHTPSRHHHGRPPSLAVSSCPTASSLPPSTAAPPPALPRRPSPASPSIEPASSPATVAKGPPSAVAVTPRAPLLPGLMEEVALVGAVLVTVEVCLARLDFLGLAAVVFHIPLVALPALLASGPTEPQIPIEPSIEWLSIGKITLRLTWKPPNGASN
eukprot:scaffold79909_cov47-Prasinocladus_malaysianus.AAC.2